MNGRMTGIRSCCLVDKSKNVRITGKQRRRLWPVDIILIRSDLIIDHLLITLQVEIKSDSPTIDYWAVRS